MRVIVGWPRVVAIVALLLGASPALAELPGDLDPTFNGGQPVLSDLARTVPRSTYLQAVTFDAEGRLILTGTSTDATGRSAAVIARLGADGSVDTSFGTDGSTVVQLGLGLGTFAPRSAANAIGPRPGGAGWLIAGGATAMDERGTGLVAAFDANGMLDIGYANGGSIRPQAGDATQSTGAAYAAIGADGSAYVASTVSTLVTGANSNLGVSKVTSGGLLDTGFGNVSARASYVNGFSESVPGTNGEAPVLTPAGLLVVGTTRSATGRSQFLVIRLTTAGALDLNFGGGTGYLRHQAADPSALNGDSQARAGAVGPDGEIYVGGVADDGDGRIALGVTRLTPGGTVDGSFGTLGTRRLQVGAVEDTFSSLTEIVVQGDGRVVVVAGTSIGASESEMVVLRLDVGGALDPSFGSNGIVRLRFGTDTFPGRATLSPDGQSVVVTGYATIDSVPQGLVTRILLEPYTAPTTTTTTLPGDSCAVAPSLVGARCRLAVLATALDEATAPGKLETKLGRTRGRADGRMAAAETASGKALRRKLRKSLGQLRKLGKQLASKPAVKDIGADTRAALVTLVTALLDELGALVALVAAA